MLILALAFAAPLAIAQDGVADSAEDIVVTARRSIDAPIGDAVEQWRTLCFDAMRQARQFRAPTDDPDWQPLDADDRRRFAVLDEGVPAYGLSDPARRHTLLIKFERFDRPESLIEDRCTMVVVGGADHARMIADINRVMRSQGTERHVGETDGSPSVRGWRQRIWTAMPPRNSAAWRGVEASGSARAGGTWIVVSDTARFYRANDYVLADLKIRQGAGQPLSVVTLSVTRRKA